MFAFSKEGNYFTSIRRCRLRLVSEAYYLLFLLEEKYLLSLSFCKSSSGGCRGATYLLLSKSWLSVLKVLARLVGLSIAGIGCCLIYCYTLDAALLFERWERLVSGVNKLLLSRVFRVLRHFMETANWKYSSKRFPWLFPNTYFCVISKQEIMGHLFSLFMGWFLGNAFSFFCHKYVYEVWWLCMMQRNCSYRKGSNLFLNTVPELFSSDWGGLRRNEARMAISHIRKWSSFFLNATFDIVLFSDAQT
jgi:hypothetical protein